MCSFCATVCCILESELALNTIIITLIVIEYLVDCHKIIVEVELVECWEVSVLLGTNALVRL